jgi:formylglycine-generating enzyme required for sulfatase activity
VRQRQLLLPLALLASAAAGAAQAPLAQSPFAARMVELKASDAAVLKASYFAAAKPGPGVLLLHQSNRTRKAWDEVGGQLAAAGINTLTLDMRGFGDSGSAYTKLTEAEKAQVRDMWPSDVETAWQFLVSQPGVTRDAVGVAGAGWFGVLHSVGLARQHPADVKSLVLLSGETLQDGLQFLRQAAQLPELFVVADDDEYPPTVEAMELLYITASNPGKRFIHYSAVHEAPWIWYETADVNKVPATGGHGTDLLTTHPELTHIVVNWFVTTLIKTPGHAPADTVASSVILNQIRTPGGITQVTQLLIDARRKDPQVQLWPEIALDIIGSDHLRAGETKEAIEFFKLNLLAYPDSADAHGNLADAYLKDGEIDPARQIAEKGIGLLDSRTAPASSWSDTEERRGEVRSGLEDVLHKANAAAIAVPPPVAALSRMPGTVFHDCPTCPEMVVLPAGTFSMGSSLSDQSWAVSHGASPESVSDESPLHSVSLRSFALGRYDVTRAEYAAFVRETRYTTRDGCGRDGEKWNKQAGVGWQNPGFTQTDRDPVVCVSWQDAHAYLSWLNGKVTPKPGNGPYRLPSESEWEYAARAGTTTLLWWGNDDAGAADHAWYKDNAAGRTHPGGMKPANPFGLYDMAGNVWQWTQDCYADNYASAPTDGSASETPKTCMRVDRGGSWYYPSWLLRPTTRERNPADYRDPIMGFRVARSLP